MSPTFYSNCVIAIAVIATHIISVFISESDKIEINDGGKLVELGEFPHHVSIELKGIRTCGGSLISLKHVLTVANCVHDIKISEIKISVGTITTSDKNLYDVEKVNSPPSYDVETWKDNIAVVWLKEEVAESKYVRAAILKKPEEELYDGRRLVVTSFGRNNPIEPKIGKLRKLTVSVCGMQNYKALFTGDLTRKFCAITTPDYSSCRIDDGDPITVKKKYLIAIFSDYSRDGCSKESPNLFIYLPDYLEDIDNLTKTN